jgi:hypothetical protein
LSKTETQELAAQGRLDVKTARKIPGRWQSAERREAERMCWTQRSVRPIWQEIRADRDESGTEAKTIREARQRTYPGGFADGQLRTLQDLIKRWRAAKG